jgi:hypothetical protein
MTHLWIIHTGEKGEINESVTLETKHQHKVGKYIREHISEFMFIFQKFAVCDDFGTIREDLEDLYHDDNIDVYDEDDEDEIVAAIETVLEDYTNEQIVDELWGTSSDSEHSDYARITKIAKNDIIKL